eukprot:1157510-Pelagomonas_calceolata.AAC.23
MGEGGLKGATGEHASPQEVAICAYKIKKRNTSWAAEPHPTAGKGKRIPLNVACILLTTPAKPTTVGCSPTSSHTTRHSLPLQAPLQAPLLPYKLPHHKVLTAPGTHHSCQANGRGLLPHQDEGCAHKEL